MKPFAAGIVALVLAAQVSTVVSRDLAAFQRAPAETGDSVTLDVVVTDARSRPVTDLRAGDIELTDNGEPRAVAAVRPRPSEGRVVGIFLDEFHVQSGDATLRARFALAKFVDTILRDGDAVALVKPLDPLHAITFTKDRSVIRSVIASFEGHAGDYTPRTEFERNFMSRDPRTAERTRAQVVSAALVSLTRRLGDQADGRKALIFISEGFRPPQPRAIVYAANRNGVAFYPLDPNLDAGDDEPMLQAFAEQTGGAASINDADLGRGMEQAMSDLDHYVVLSFTRAGPEDGRFHPVQVHIKRPGVQARARSGYWAPDAALAAAVAKATAPRNTLPFRPSHSTQYIRPWIGMSRGPDGLTSVTVTWESGAAPPRNQRVAAIIVKAMGEDGAILFERRIGAGDADRVTFNAPPGYVALEMALESSSGAPLDTDYRGLSVPNLKVTRPTFATPQVLRTRTARDFAEVSQDPNAIPVAARTFSRTERLLIRVPAYAAGNTFPIVRARLLNRRGIAMRDLNAVDASLPPGTVQFDLPLASLAPDEYRVELSAANAAGPKDEAIELIAFRVTN